MRFLYRCHPGTVWSTHWRCSRRSRSPHRFCHDHHDLCRLFGSHARQGDRNEPVELPNPAQKCFWPRQESAVASW